MFGSAEAVFAESSSLSPLSLLSLLWARSERQSDNRTPSTTRPGARVCGLRGAVLIRVLATFDFNKIMPLGFSNRAFATLYSIDEQNAMVSWRLHDESARRHLPDPPGSRADRLICINASSSLPELLLFETSKRGDRNQTLHRVVGAVDHRVHSRKRREGQCRWFTANTSDILRLIPGRAHPYVVLLLGRQDHRHDHRMDRFDDRVRRRRQESVDQGRP